MRRMENDPALNSISVVLNNPQSMNKIFLFVKDTGETSFVDYEIEYYK